ncbi:MAG: hypothetical protein ACWA5R_11565 [bacterium]
MRIDLDIDDYLLQAIKECSRTSKKSLEQVVNETLELGLIRLANQPLPAVSLGETPAHINLDKALGLAGELEDQLLATKMLNP